MIVIFIQKDFFLKILSKETECILRLATSNLNQPKSYFQYAMVLSQQQKIWLKRLDKHFVKMERRSQLSDRR